MSGFRKVTEDFWVSPQISIDDVGAARAAGFTLIINNRPDDEDPGQPRGADIEAAARAASLDYVAVPFAGRPSPGQVEAVRQAVEAAAGKTLAYCRSGTRSISIWALGRLDGSNRDELVRAGEAAGYDLRAVVGG